MSDANATSGQPWADPPPPRDAAASTGRAVFAELDGAALEDRERRIENEVEQGNVPGLLRRGRSVALRGVTADGVAHVIEFVALPDYLAIGSDQDFVRVPLTPTTANRIAERHGFLLPTPKMVDAIHAAAEIHLEPRPLTESRESASTFVEHDDLCRAQLGDARRDVFVSGIKKDVVATPESVTRPDRVAIYGWHRLDGEPIQPLYLGHSASYVDYSHGIRLVRREARLDGKAVDLRELLRDPVLCWLVSDEGPFPAF